MVAINTHNTINNIYVYSRGVIFRGTSLMRCFVRSRGLSILCVTYAPANSDKVVHVTTATQSFIATPNGISNGKSHLCRVLLIARLLGFHV